METKKIHKGMTEEETQYMLYHASRPDIEQHEVHQIYEQWAHAYDKTMGNTNVYTGPSIGVTELSSLLGDRHDARILDAAAGTGQCGVLLLEKGYKNIDALEPNKTMVAQAKKTNAYTNFYLEYLGPNRLNIADDSFDAVLTTGSFIPGHVKEDCYEELARITKPGGYIVNVMNERYLDVPEYGPNIEPRLKFLQNHGVWKLLERKTVPKFQGKYNGVVFVIQLASQKNEKLQTLK